METHQSLPGLRTLDAAQIGAALALEVRREQLGNPGRDRLITARKDAAHALGLRGAAGQVLEKLCACYGGELIKGDIIVWPGNRWLVTSTCLDERTIRRAIQRLIRLGLVIPKDSPRRYRYCVRGSGGEIQDAFGFILSPLIQRHAEFAGMVLKQERERKQRAALDDEISRHRIAVKVALNAALPYDLQDQTAALSTELAALERQIPRRGRPGVREPIAQALAELRGRSELLFYELTKPLENQSNDTKMSGSAGHDARHLEKQSENSIEDYKAAEEGMGGAICGPPQTVQHEVETAIDAENGAKSERPAPDQTASLALVIEACPAIEDAGLRHQTVRGFIEAAYLLRGWFGASPDAWREGAKTLGELPTALLAVYVYQLSSDRVVAQGALDRAVRADNFGGLFRSLIRKTANGQFSLQTALLKMRHKRMT
jgi:replication initiation protein RepC